jgi:hypothetical protein
MAKYIVVHSVRVCTEFTPEVFGRLTTIGPAFRLRYARGSNTFHVCACSCGNSSIHQLRHLINGSVVSCGCYREEQRRIRTRTHGKTKTKEHRIWSGIRNRYMNERNQAYPDYGGRGIKVCERWDSFECFLEDMGVCPGP